MVKEIAVRYMVLQGIEDGISGFYEKTKDKNCVKPNKPYKCGACHTKGDEMDKLALVVGFKTREEFAKEFAKEYKNDNWPNAYGRELSKYVKDTLETKGIDWEVNGESVRFYSPPNEFVLWPKPNERASKIF